MMCVCTCLVLPPRFNIKMSRILISDLLNEQSSTLCMLQQLMIRAFFITQIMNEGRTDQSGELLRYFFGSHTFTTIAVCQSCMVTDSGQHVHLLNPIKFPKFCIIYCPFCLKYPKQKKWNVKLDPKQAHAIFKGFFLHLQILKARKI